MSYDATWIPFGELTRFIPALQRNLLKSELWTQGRATIDDIVKFIYLQQMQLWVVHETEQQKIVGYVITEIKQYPRAKYLVMQYSAGDVGVLESAGDRVFEVLENFAKAEGCAGIEFFGRPGWRRHARKHGCTEETVVYEKKF